MAGATPQSLEIGMAGRPHVVDLVLEGVIGAVIQLSSLALAHRCKKPLAHSCCSHWRLSHDLRRCRHEHCHWRFKQYLFLGKDKPIACIYDLSAIATDTTITLAMATHNSFVSP